MAPHILVVDDDPAILDMVCWALEDEGFATTCAQDGVEALDQLRRRSPDLILLDLRMPRLSGWDLYRILRANPATEKIPVVVMTADQSAHRAHPALRGAELLPKPFDLNALVETISHQLP